MGVRPLFSFQIPAAVFSTPFSLIRENDTQYHVYNTLQQIILRRFRLSSLLTFASDLYPQKDCYKLFVPTIFSNIFYIPNIYAV